MVDAIQLMPKRFDVGMSDAQIAEERDKIHERFQYTLCPKCREQFRGILKGMKGGGE